jgi:Natural resistance-associated macrophage protein
VRHSLHRRWREARTFHRTYAACVLAAAAVVLIPQVPLGLLTTAVQALAGVLLPSATVFLLLLCNDREVLGPLVNPRWLNVLAATVIGALLGLSALLTATTIVPRLPLVPAVTGVAAAVAVLAAGATLIAIRARPAPAPGPADRRTWTMPPVESLRPPARSAWRTLGLVVLRCYLLAAIIALAVRAIQLALGAG